MVSRDLFMGRWRQPSVSVNTLPHPVYRPVLKLNLAKDI